MVFLQIKNMEKQELVVRTSKRHQHLSSIVRVRMGTGTFKCYRRMGSIKNGVFTNRATLPGVSQLTNATWVSGGDLYRYTLLEPEPLRGSGRCLLRALRVVPSEANFDMNCDACSRKHKPGNGACSATLNLSARPYKRGYVYGRSSRSMVGRFRENEIIEMSGAVYLVMLSAVL